MAMEDALVISKCLTTEQDPVAALRHFEDRRRERTAMIQRMAWSWGAMFHWQNPIACLARNTFMTVTPASKIRESLETLLGYEAWAAA
jgi:2-polyprenyl-6-methoxyphenol hydroxylase-like FAD-dependent oxidoreductase